MKPIIDPRDGDIEDDASSTKRRSLFSLAGSLLVEISLPKLAVAWTLLIGLPGIILRIAPLLLSLWIGTVSWKASVILTGDLACRASIGARRFGLVCRASSRALDREQLLVSERFGRSASATSSVVRGLRHLGSKGCSRTAPALLGGPRSARPAPRRRVWRSARLHCGSSCSLGRQRRAGLAIL